MKGVCSNNIAGYKSGPMSTLNFTKQMGLGNVQKKNYLSQKTDIKYGHYFDFSSEFDCLGVLLSSNNFF